MASQRGIIQFVASNEIGNGTTQVHFRGFAFPQADFVALANGSRRASLFATAIVSQRGHRIRQTLAITKNDMDPCTVVVIAASPLPFATLLRLVLFGATAFDRRW